MQGRDATGNSAIVREHMGQVINEAADSLVVMRRADKTPAGRAADIQNRVVRPTTRVGAMLDVQVLSVDFHSSNQTSVYSLMKNFKAVLLSGMIGIMLVSSASAAFSWCALWGTCQPAGPPPFVPAFYGNVTIDNGFGKVTYVNTDYFASIDTANIVCKKFGCAYVYAPPVCDLGGGAATCSEPEYFLMFPDCYHVNAGILAAYFGRNPEDLFPGLAFKLVVAQMAADRAQLKPSCAPTASLIPFPSDTATSGMRVGDLDEGIPTPTLPKDENPFALPGEAYIQSLIADLLII